VKEKKGKWIQFGLICNTTKFCGAQYSRNRHLIFSWLGIEISREYWMIYRGPSFLAPLFGLSPTPPSPLLSRQSSTGDTLEDWVWETTCWSHSIQWRESLVLYKSFSTLWTITLRKRYWRMREENCPSTFSCDKFRLDIHYQGDTFSLLILSQSFLQSLFSVEGPARGAGGIVGHTHIWNVLLLNVFF
jgi:hypothetical protein